MKLFVFIRERLVIFLGLLRLVVFGTNSGVKLISDVQCDGIYDKLSCQITNAIKVISRSQIPTQNCANHWLMLVQPQLIQIPRNGC